jgi:heme-degrading monooxygenase HmoA
MHANVTTFRRRPERLNEVGLDDIASIVHRLVGYQGAYVLVDRGSGLQLTITLWDTEESMNAAIAELQPIREQRARELDDTAPPSRRAFEVVAWDRPD